MKILEIRKIQKIRKFPYFPLFTCVGLAVWVNLPPTSTEALGPPEPLLASCEPLPRTVEVLA